MNTVYFRENQRLACDMVLEGPPFLQREIELLDIKQKTALEMALEEKSFFFSGPGGTGKSFCVNVMIKVLRSRGKRVMVAASTNHAAEKLDGGHGKTVYKLFNTYSGGYSFDKRSIKRLMRSLAMSADVIIIDEISMVDKELFTYIIKAIKIIEKLKNSRIQLIIVGDFFQLPPVRIGKNNKRNYAFDSPYWFEYMSECVELDTPHRQQDMEYIARLLEIRRGVNLSYNAAWIKKHAHFLEEKEGAVYLVPRKKDAEKINNEHISRLPGTSKTYYAAYKGHRKKNWFSGYMSLYLKVGARVMTIVNDSRGRFINGSFGTVAELKDDAVIVRLDARCGEEPRLVELTMEEFINDNYNDDENNNEKPEEDWVKQIPLIPAYALTIHKAQGCTLECANIDLTCFEDGQFYVALSRIKKIENVYIIKDFSERHIMVNPRVLLFYESYRRNTAA